MDQEPFFALIILFIAVVILLIALPVIVLHYITQWKKARGLSVDDERLLQSLFANIQKMEDRIINLEHVLEPTKAE